jgi:hypothetical protein
MVLDAGSLQVYVYSEMLALFAAQPYGTAGLTDLEAHLTNTCCQSDSGLREEDLVRLLSELPEVRWVRQD